LFLGLFILGTVIGSFLNVVIYRLPLGKSLLHPPSQCGSCGYRIPFRENLPLISFLRLKGRCRNCGAPFSSRYFWMELLTGLGFVAIYFFEICWEPTCHYQFGGFWSLAGGTFPPGSWLVFFYHAFLFCYLLVAAAISAEQGWLPRQLTWMAVCLTLVCSPFVAWPWPNDRGINALASSGPSVASSEALPLQKGVQLWPVWNPLPVWLPAASMQLGLLTSLAGAAVGLLLARAALWPLESSKGRRPLGAGETDFLAGAGAFLGWQPMVSAVALAITAAYVGAIVVRALGRRSGLLGPVLAAAVVIVWLGWTWIGPLARPFLSNSHYMLALAGILLALLFAGLHFRPPLAMQISSEKEQD
jgi:leader peptidase (prepilin peptidase)/N-methyltransferase